jgi:VanZ family protein
VNRIVPLWLRIAAWFSVIAWAVAITILSSMTPRQLASISPFSLWDKAAHFLAFAGGAALLTLALRWSTSWRWRQIVLVTAAAVALFGVIDEYHQTFTPHRSGADLGDWIADVLGAVVGTIATSLFHARSTRTHHLAPAGD